MWKDSELSCIIKRTCPECETYPMIIDRFSKAPIKCCTCNGFKNFIRCSDSDCDFKTEICLQCETSKPLQQKIRPKPKEDQHSLLHISIWVAGITVVLAVLFVLFKNSSSVQDSSNIGKLRQGFPSQKNETWYHILSVLEQKVPTVKSITLLHKNDRKTSDCLAKELVNIFSRNAKMGEVSFDLDGIQYRDYGEVLEHYRSVVRKFRVLVTNLRMVPSNIARVFHSLCDEVASDIKPSLFIFTLQWDKETGHLKPIEKATTILKQAWGDLPDSDIFPLLSRVVKNVVDVVPEKQVTC